MNAKPCPTAPIGEDPDHCDVCNGYGERCPVFVLYHLKGPCAADDCLVAAKASRDVKILAYQLAIREHQAADDRLSELLHAKYGKRAGDMRYKPAETVEIAEAMRAKLEAGERQQTTWLATMRG